MFVLCSTCRSLVIHVHSTQSLHERRLSTLVSRPEFYEIVESRPFRPRSRMICAPQSFSLELNYMAATVSMRGYDEGKRAEAASRGPVRKDQSAHSPVRLGVEKEDGWMVAEGERGGAVHRVLNEEAIAYVLSKATNIFSSLHAYSPLGVICDTSPLKLSPQSKPSLPPRTSIPGRQARSSSSTAISLPRNSKTNSTAPCTCTQLVRARISRAFTRVFLRSSALSSKKQDHWTRKQDTQISRPSFMTSIASRISAKANRAARIERVSPLVGWTSSRGSRFRRPCWIGRTNSKCSVRHTSLLSPAENPRLSCVTGSLEVARASSWKSGQGKRRETRGESTVSSVGQRYVRF